MGYALHSVENLGPPFWLVQEQMVLVPAAGFHPVRNGTRKLLLVLGGECRHRVLGYSGPGADAVLRAGDCLALPHACEQRYLSEGRETRLHVLRLAFDPELLPLLPLRHRPDGAAGEPGDLTALADAALQELRCLPARSAEPLQETVRQILGELARDAPSRFRLHALCASLTVLFARLTAGEAEKSAAVPGNSYVVARTKLLLRERLAEPLRLSDLAGAVGVSEEHLARQFKRVTGTTVFGHLRRLRVERARHLLATSDENLGEIAARAGFSSPTLFSRCFREETGSTPSGFRKRLAREIG